jgi:hypothetical protein
MSIENKIGHQAPDRDAPTNPPSGGSSAIITLRASDFISESVVGMLKDGDMFIHRSRFSVKDRVIIDSCSDLVAIITGVLIKEKHVLYEVSWFHNGADQSKYIEEYRLELKG